MSEHIKKEETRIEKDILGEMALPKNVYYGINSVRASKAYTVSGYPMHKELIIALATVKKAAARANEIAGQLPKETADAIVKACREIEEGKLHDEFIGEAIQGGAGTGMNMNANEVIANRALLIMGHEIGDYSKIHPLDHVNKGQSTNDVVPTAIRIAAIRLLRRYIDAAKSLEKALSEKAFQYGETLKLGRTHLQDAVPITVGQELKAWAHAVARDVRRGERAADLLSRVNMGGTAVGTTVNAHEDYVANIAKELCAASGIELRLSADLMDATQNLDVLVEVSGFMKAAATTLTKISNDLRLMASGPMAGLAEAMLPAMAAGSTIMPGKINPVIPEIVNQVCFKVYGNDLTISLAASAGQFELNVMQPVLSFCLFESIDMLTGAMRALAKNAVEGLEFNVVRCQRFAGNSFSLVTGLAPVIGQEKASSIYLKARQQGLDVLEVVMQEGILDEESARALLNPNRMTGKIEKS